MTNTHPGPDRLATSRLIVDYMAHGGASAAILNSVGHDRPVVACEWDSVAREVIAQIPDGSGALILIRRGDTAIYALNADQTSPAGMPGVSASDCGPTSMMGQVWDTLSGLTHGNRGRSQAPQPLRVSVQNFAFELAQSAGRTG